MKNPVCASGRNQVKEICGVIDGESPGRPPVRLSRFRWQRSARGAWIYDIRSDAVFETNDTALEILRLLAEGRSCQQIAAHLVSRYRVSMDAALADVKGFLCALTRHGFMENS